MARLIAGVILKLRFKNPQSEAWPNAQDLRWNTHALSEIRYPVP